MTLILTPFSAFAQGARIIIRDAESENIIRALAVPLFQAAGLNPDAVRIRMIQNKQLNAFVSGGQNIFLHTGLIVSADGPDALMGVIAHETGHIEGGHLVRSREAIAEASAIQMIGTLLGAAAGIAARDGRVGQAVIAGSAQAGAQSFLQFSRTQESAADQAAMRLLDATGRSAKGLERFLGKLDGQDLLTPRFQDPYVRTHPLSKDRMDILARHNATSRFADTPAPADEKLLFDRMVGKLYGFLEPLSAVLKRYPETDQSLAARYARAIAYYRAPDLTRALELIDALIEESPNDPYFHELKGQMLFEHGHAREALQSYRQAVKLVPMEPLILLELARVELELNDPTLLDQSIEHFRLAARLGEGSGFVWRQLGIAYGRKGDMAMSSLALAEAELRIGQFANAEFQATRASEMLEPGTGAHLQALDILEAIKVYRAEDSGK